MSRSSNIDVAIRLRNQRQFNSQVRRSAAELEAMGMRGARAIGSFATKAQGLKNFGSRWTSNVTLPVAGLAAIAGKTAIDFSKSMGMVRVALKAPEAEMDELRQLAIQMGADTIFSANDAAQAMLELSKGGMSAAQIKGGALAATMSLAAAGGIELAEAGTQITASMNTFGIGANRSQQIADALAAAANSSSAELSGLSQSFQQAGQQAAMSGMSLYETAGTLAAFAQNGISASDAGTSLKTFLQRLAPTSTKAKEKMAELGLEFFDAQGNMKSMPAIAGELEKALSSLTQEQRISALNTMFGSDASRAAGIIYKEGAKGIEGWVKASKEKAAADKMSAAQMEGLPGAWEKLKGSMETAALTLGNAATPALLVLAGALGAVADAFTGLPPEMQSVIVGMLILAALTGPAAMGLGFMAAGAGRLLIGLKMLTTGFRIFAALRAAFMVGGITAAMAQLTAAFPALGAAITFAMGPVGLIILAVAALTAGFVLLYLKVGWFHRAVDNVWDFIKDKFPLLQLAFGPLLGTLILVARNFQTIKTVAMSVFNWLKGALGTYRKAMMTGWGAVAGVVSGAFIGIVNRSITSLNWLIGAFNSVFDREIDPPGPGPKWSGLHINEIGQIGSSGAPVAAETAASTIGSGGRGKGRGGTTGIPGAARGANVNRRGLLRVGEKGEELLDLSPPARVTPLDRLRSGDLHLTIPVVLANGREIARATVTVSEDDLARA